MRHRYWAIALFSLSAVGAVWGCETPLEPDYVLDRPRFLALRSEPVALVPDAGTVLDALLYLPPGSPAATYEWTWCAQTSTELECTVTADALTAALDPDGGYGIKLDYALGSGATANFGYPGVAAALEAACRNRGGPTAPTDAGDDAGDAGDGGDAGDAGDDAGTDAGAGVTVLGDGGVTLTCGNGSVTFDVLVTATVGTTKLKAVRTITVYYTAPSTTDTNPTITSIAVGDGTTPMTGELGLFATIPPTATDLYAGRIVSADASANTTDGGRSADDAGIYESLTASWYVQSGRLADASTSLAEAEADASRDFAPVGTNRWTVTDPGTYSVIVVLRDNRGGVGWLTKSVTVGGAK